MTTKVKLLFLNITILIVGIASVLIVVNDQFVKVIDANQHALYNERLDTVIGLLQGYEDRLQKTGQVAAYSDSFKESALKTLKQTYRQQHKQGISPFIIDQENEFVLLHPNTGTLSLVKSAVLSKMTSLMSLDKEPSGSFELQQSWYIYKRFDKWNWKIAFTVPLETKYVQVEKLRHILISIMLGAGTLSIVILWWAITQITKPIGILTQVTKAISAGNYSSEIEVSSSGEIGQLIQSFIRMRDKLTGLFAERDQRITELELTKQELLAREKSLEQYTQRLAIHLEHTPLGVIEWDLDFKVVQWNRASEKIFGYSSKEAIGKSASELILSESTRELIEPILADLFAGRGGTRMTNENIAKDGTILTCDWYNTTLVDSNGLIMGVASLIQDISEAKELEDQLRQAHKMEAIGTMAGGIAHDFNNILAAILGYAEMAMLDTPDSSPVRHHIQQVLKAGNRAKELVKHILSFSRKEAGQKLPVHIHPLIKEVSKLLRASIPSTIEIQHQIDPQAGSILADPTEVHQVLMNLCTNATQSMDEDAGILKIELMAVQLNVEDLRNEPYLKPGPFVRLTVKDSGSGIDQKLLDKIFDPYFTTKEVGKGSGMGLAVVIGIVKRLDGFITVDSKIGKGTSFNVYFPKIQENVQEIVEDHSPLPVGSEKILVVDDEESIAHMLEELLERQGYQVTTRTDSTEALDLFRSRPNFFDLVITDHTMPKMTGEQLAKKVIEVREDIPIIICTGYSSRMDVARANMAGIHAFLMKPVAKRELVKTIRRVLDGSTSHP